MDRDHSHTESSLCPAATDRLLALCACMLQVEDSLLATTRALQLGLERPYPHIDGFGATDRAAASGERVDDHHYNHSVQQQILAQVAMHVEDAEHDRGRLASSLNPAQRIPLTISVDGKLTDCRRAKLGWRALPDKSDEPVRCESRQGLGRARGAPCAPAACTRRDQEKSS